MPGPLLRRVLSPLVELRPGEAPTSLLLFLYAFLAMTSYNIVQPLTRSKLISSLGAVNIPYVIFGASLVIGVLMLLYTRVVSRLPRRWALPIVQVAMAFVMVGFWAWFQREEEWASVAFYLWGLILGLLLVSQFWTLANAIYDPRQAKRLFGFIGGGVTLGGATGAAITRFMVESIGTNALLLWSAAVLIACMVVVVLVLGREQQATPPAKASEVEKGVTLRRAGELLKSSRQIQLIALVIAFGSIGAALIDQQLNMAAEVFKGRGEQDAIGAFLAEVRVYLSLAAFFLQVWVTPWIHRYLGIGVALMLLPLGLSATATTILIAAALWAPAVASVLDRSIRYTVDKTTREVLFLPLPSDLRQEVKPFVDVTVDRLSRGLGSVLMLVLIQPWGLALEWYQLSLVSLFLAGAWFVLAFRAKREYLESFRKSIQERNVEPTELRVDVADLSTIETLMEELASPDERRVLYAIGILESLDKRNLVTPLLLFHESPAVRIRVLEALGAGRPEIAERWLPSIQKTLSDESPEVRAAAVTALATIRGQQVTELLRPYLRDRDARIATTAAVVMARSGIDDDDVKSAEAVLSGFVADTSASGAPARREVARALRQIPDRRFLPLLIPLLQDARTEVAEEAMSAVRALGSCEALLVPTLIALLSHRRLKSAAREVLVGYGDDVLDALEHFLRDPEEDLWVRRHIPATLARIPTQKSMDILVGTLEDRDGFLRYKTVAAVEKLRRDAPALAMKKEPIESLLLKESLRYLNYLSLRYNVFVRGGVPTEVLLERALREKLARTLDRCYRLLGLLSSQEDIAAARRAIERGDARTRASALEYLDNTLSASIRKRIMLMLEDVPADEKVRRVNVLLKTRVRDVEETLLSLINDEDPVVSAAAIALVEERELWALAPDIEHVFEHRSVADRYVFEAASWTLATHRMSESRRRSLWLEPLPVVELAAVLQRIPLFSSVSMDELFRIAALGRQVRYEEGHVLYHEGTLPAEAQFLLDGALSASSRDGAGLEIAPPAPLGLEAVLDGSAVSETVRALGNSVCLTLSADELRSLVSDDSELLHGLLRMLVSENGVPTASVVRGRGVDAPLSSSKLTPIERALLLENVPLFQGIAEAEILSLASIAREVSLDEEGQPIEETGVPSLWIVIEGRLSLDSSLVAERGDSVGVLETLSGMPLGRRGVVVTRGRALRIDGEDLFDLLGQRPSLLQGLFAALFRSRRE